MEFCRHISYSILLILIAASFLYQESGAGDKPVSYPTNKLFGFVHVWGKTEHADDNWNNSTFMLARARLGAMGKIRNNISYIILTEAGELAIPNLVVPTSKGICLVDCYVTFELDPLFNLRIGQDYYRFTYEGNLILPKLPFIFRTEAVDAVWLPMGRDGSYAYDVGLWVFGELDSSNFPFTGGYQMACTNGSGLKSSDNNSWKDFNARLYLEPFQMSSSDLVKQLHFGGSLFIGVSTEIINSQQSIQKDLDESAWAVEFVLPTKQWRLIGEWIWADYDGAGEVSRWRQSGGYAALGITPIKNLEMLGRYAYYNQNMDVSNVVLHTTTLGFTYTFAKLTNLKVNYLIRQTGDRYPEKLGDLLIAQLQFMW